MNLPITLTVCLLVATALPSLAQAEQQRPAYSPPVEQPVVRDKTSGAYLQSVGRHVADRPLACPSRRSSRTKRPNS